MRRLTTWHFPLGVTIQPFNFVVGGQFRLPFGALGSVFRRPVGSAGFIIA
jgi:hypothetical protein